MPTTSSSRGVVIAQAVRAAGSPAVGRVPSPISSSSVRGHVIGVQTQPAMLASWPRPWRWHSPRLDRSMQVHHATGAASDPSRCCMSMIAFKMNVCEDDEAALPTAERQDKVDAMRTVGTAKENRGGSLRSVLGRCWSCWLIPQARMRGAAVAMSPVFGVPVGSISRICTSPRATGRCSTPLGTTNTSP